MNILDEPDEREEAPEWRGEDARRLLANPLIQEAYANFEKEQIEKAISAPVTDDETRYRCMVAIQVCRQVEKHLTRVVFDGNKAVKSANEADNPSRFV